MEKKETISGLNYKRSSEYSQPRKDTTLTGGVFLNTKL